MFEFKIIRKFNAEMKLKAHSIDDETLEFVNRREKAII
jgi:hypothetical protein